MSKMVILDLIGKKKLILLNVALFETAYFTNCPSLFCFVFGNTKSEFINHSLPSPKPVAINRVFQTTPKCFFFNVHKYYYKYDEVTPPPNLPP